MHTAYIREVIGSSPIGRTMKTINKIDFLFLVIYFVVLYISVKTIDLNIFTGPPLASIMSINGLIFLLALFFSPIVFTHFYFRKIIKEKNNIIQAVMCCFIFVPMVVYPINFIISWLLDYNGTASESSTSALAWIFVPIYAWIYGIFFIAVSYIYSRKINSTNYSK